MKFVMSVIYYDRDYSPAKLSEDFFASHYFPDIETAQKFCQKESNCWGILRAIPYDKYKKIYYNFLWKHILPPETILSDSEMQLLQSQFTI